MVRSPHTEERETLAVRDLLAVAPEDTLGEVAAKMMAQKTNTALVVDCGRIVGVLSGREVVRAAAERMHPSEGRAREWMTEVPRGVERGHDETVCEFAWETGTLEACPGDACTFWWRDGCVLAGLAEDIADHPDRASFFLRMREERADHELQGSLRQLPGF